MILGVDVWSGYGVIDWAKAKAAGVEFAIIKHTEGNEGCDPSASRNVAGCKAAGVPCGAYLFGFPLPDHANKTRSPEWQAQKLFADCQALGTQPGDLPPVLDLEWPPQWERDKKTGQLVNKWEQWGVDAASIAAWGLACLAELERLFGRVPVIYTYPHFWQSLGEHGKNPAFARYPLWIANYTHSNAQTPPDGAKPIVPAPWSDYAIWQFSADGSPVRVPGIPACPLDRNVVKNRAALEALIMPEPTPLPDTPDELGCAAVDVFSKP